MLLAHDRVSFRGMERAIEYNRGALYVRYNATFNGKLILMLVERYAEILGFPGLDSLIIMQVT